MGDIHRSVPLRLAFLFATLSTVIPKPPEWLAAHGWCPNDAGRVTAVPCRASKR
jgi:hypothetical protein